MHKKYNKQDGFGLIEVLLIIIALCLVVFVGYYIYHSSKAVKTTPAKTSTSVSDNQAKATSDPNLTAAAAAAQAQKTYNSYYVVLSGGTVDPSTYFDEHPELFTTKFAKAADNAAPNSGNSMLCGQFLQYDSLTAAPNPTISGQTAKVTINENVGQTVNTVPVTMVYQGGKWLVDATDCTKA